MKIKILLLLCMFFSNSCFASTDVAATAINNVSSKLYDELKKKDGNVFFSPYSIVTALAMVAEGARARTADEFKQLFELGSNSNTSFDGLHYSLNQLVTDLIPFTVDQDNVNSELAKLKLELKKLRNPQGNDNPFAGLMGLYNPSSKQREKEYKLVNKINELNKKVAPYKFTQANAIWLDQSITLKEAYVNKLNEMYKLDSVYNVDFKNRNEEAVKKINQWCNDNTNGKISSIVAKLPKVTKMVLANAIYFKGIWQDTFKEEQTRDESFYVNTKNPIKTPMMNKSFKIAYTAFNGDGSVFNTPQYHTGKALFKAYPSKGGYQVVEIPYKGNKISMVLVVPLDLDGLDRLESKLNYEMLNNAISKVTNPIYRRDVALKLPKFKFETEYQLKDQLKLIGLRESFTNNANFSGISPTALKISEVVHKAFVDVNEEGTEAAAVTAIMMAECTSARTIMQVPFVPEVKANRPFLFAIVHKESKSILFMGRVSNPKV